MSTFTEQQQLRTNASTKIETSMYTNTGYFGIALLEYGACHIGSEIWLKHGLTMQDKEDFENYQNGCEALRGASIDDPILRLSDLPHLGPLYWAKRHSTILGYTQIKLRVVARGK